MRIARAALLPIMIAAAAGCAQGGSPEPDAPGGAVTPALEDPLVWQPVDAAFEYRVQVWDGMRLLFEETRRLPELRVTPSMQRSLRGAGDVELRVQALGAEGQLLGEAQVRRLQSAGA